MSQISDVVSVVADMLRGGGGLQTNIDSLTTAENISAITVTTEQVIAQNLPSDIAERSMAVKYPSVYVYCEKTVNQLREKFRTFSGTAGMALEIRISSDRVEDLDVQLGVLVDAVASTLNQNRGDWGGGMFFGGAYEISFGPVKHGGKNFIQAAKVTFDLNISRN